MKQSFYVKLSRQTCTCPHCHSHTGQIKDYREQKILLSWFNNVPVYAFFRKRRFLYPVCSHSFYAPTPLVHPCQRRNQYQQLAIHECARKQSFTDIVKPISSFCYYRHSLFWPYLLRENHCLLSFHISEAHKSYSINRVPYSVTLL